jgi:hypothetical protein
METALANKIETNAVRAAAACFAGACGYAAWSWLSAFVTQPALGAETGGAAALAYLCCLRVLGAVDARPHARPIPIFDLRAYEPLGETELLLTEWYEVDASVTAEPLVLDDVLAELKPDSRVVRLFDPASMPTPGELKSRIDRHLANEAPTAGAPDATQALHDALAELRRAIR